ncbi:MAG: DoxX family protein [Actinomycetota bacterium]
MTLFRVVFGLIFAAHGYAKVFRGGRLAGTGGWFDSIGMRPGAVHARLAAGTEIVAGVLLAVGLVTPLAAAAVVGVMIVAGYAVHRANGFFIVSEGWEYTFIVGFMAVLIAALGPGGWSLDAALGIDDLNGFAGLGIALGLGLAGGVGQLAIFYRPPTG